MTSRTVENTETTTVTPVTISPKGGYFDSSCARKVHLEHDAAYADSELEPIPAADQARMDAGHVREALVAEMWADAVEFTSATPKMLTIADESTLSFEKKVTKLSPLMADTKAFSVPSCDRSAASKSRREVLTMAALDAGVSLVWNARLPAAGPRISEPDFLVRAGDAPKPNGKWAYRPGDVKDAAAFGGSAAASKYPLSSLVDYTYEDAKRVAKHTGTPKLKHTRQLAHYHVHLAEFGHESTGAKLWGAIFGREDVLVWRDLNEACHLHLDRGTGERRRMSALEIYLQEFGWRVDVAIAASDPSAEAMVGPEKKSECGSCPWREVCRDEMLEMDHITLLAGVTPERARVHYAAGITSRAELARLDWATAKVLDAGVDVAAMLANSVGAFPGDAAETLLPGRGGRAALEKAGLVTVADVLALDVKTAQAYAGLKTSGLADAIDKARVAKVGKVHLARGVEKLVVPRADIELDVDMENQAGGIIYLWGTRLVIRHENLRIPGPGYRPFATFGVDDYEGEANAFAGMWSWMQSLRTLAAQSGLTFKAYCYTGAEVRCMRHLVKEYAGMRGIPSSEELEEFIDSEEWVDLYTIVESNLVWPTEDLGLKSLAKWARHSWRDTDASGDSSTVWYTEATTDPDEATRDAAQRRLLEYNEDDVVATWVLRDWLTRLATARQPGQKLPNVASLESRFARRVRRTRAA
jgi:predicted RecB family nuclease